MLFLSLSHQVPPQGLCHMLGQTVAAREAKQMLELAAGPALFHSRASERCCGHWIRRLPWSFISPQGCEVWERSFLPPDHMMILKRDLQNQESLLPPVQPAATHTHYGIAEQRAEGRGLHQQLDTTCSHHSLAIQRCMGGHLRWMGGTAFFTHRSKTVGSY